MIVKSEHKQHKNDDTWALISDFLIAFLQMSFQFQREFSIVKCNILGSVFPFIKSFNLNLTLLILKIDVCVNLPQVKKMQI